MAFAMQCNIDAKGRAVRLVSGIICAAVGIVLVVLALAAEGGFWPLLGTGLGFFAAGIFQDLQIGFEKRGGVRPVTPLT